MINIHKIIPTFLVYASSVIKSNTAFGHCTCEGFYVGKTSSMPDTNEARRDRNKIITDQL
jgi:hypothetical protein